MNTQTNTSSRSFAALHHPGFRIFLFGNMLAMMADNVEHVVSYWVIFQEFKSPALAGFAVIAHWLPFLLFSVPVGVLGERVDPRRLIQLGMTLFMLVSLAWALLIYTHSLQIWHAVALLIVHGIAGVLWGPPTQLLIHDIVGRERLPSAVRLNATGRYLGIFLGPAVGSGLMLLVGPTIGLLVNIAIYLPLTAWLWKAPYGPRFRTEQAAPAVAMRSVGDVMDSLAHLGRYPVIAFMTVLSGGAAFFIGNSYQAQMPAFAMDLGHGDPGVAYSALLAADAAGALLAGFALESFNLLRPNPRTAMVLALLWCVALGGFALSSSYSFALLLLFAAGFLELSFNSMSQTLVQLHAPMEMRGRMVGVFSMAAMGMRTFSGVSVGLLGQAFGVHWSLSISAAFIAVLVVTLLSNLHRLQPITQMRE